MHRNVNVISIINKHVIYFCPTSFKWFTVFKCYFCICIAACNCYITCHKNVCIRIIKKPDLIKSVINRMGFSFLYSSFVSLSITCQTWMGNYLNRLVDWWFFESPFYMILTRFCEKLKVVSSDFLIIKTLVAYFQAF